jgi:hypothetical protein
MPQETEKEETMQRRLNVAFTDDPDPDDMALILEVIAGEIRRGCVSGSETEFSWTVAGC